MTQTTPNYKKTLNLPKTSFPMRANLAQNEPQTVKKWEAETLYSRVLAAHADDSPFVFHDGPPYANGSIHVGHLLNKVLKDIVVRSRAMSGRRVSYVPGWDCHGLPIEHRVMTGLEESGKADKINALDDDARRMAIRRECRRYAEKYVKLHTSQMKRLLTLADYDHPYLTMDPAYEAAVLEVFAMMVERGLVFRQLKPVHWSIANQTALAEAELEYMDREDPSIFVAFDAVDRSAVAAAFDVTLDTNASFLIWTTTPWTLVANLAIAVSPRFQYSLVRFGDRAIVVASDLVERVASKVGAAPEILGETTGDRLLGLQYAHPFCDRSSPIIAADHVTLEDGTGLVHTAPGHGTEDYMVGLAEGLDIYCPVQGDGTYDDTVPQWLQGLDVWTANGVVLDHLRESGHLLHDEPHTHSYPHDGRGKTPVIFRSTEQWFVAVDGDLDGTSLRDRALAATADDITFIPQWGQRRMRGMLESRPDWCLSRQRSWGLPIPAFMQPDGTPLLTPETIRCVAKVIAAEGSDAWFTKSPQELLAQWDAPSNVDVSSLQKMHDIFDVWFESGSSWHAVMQHRELGYPIDLYLEGGDQHRGWFQLSMLPAIAVTGSSPFACAITHGFIVDKDGHKMSKSGGNALGVDDLLKQFGADVCRWWVGSLVLGSDSKVDMKFFEEAGESYRKIRNTLRFLLGNMGEASEVGTDDLTVDAWALGELSRVSDAVIEAYAAFEFRRVHTLLYDFCNDTLSSVYCAAVKDRLYCDASDSPRRQRTQATMRIIADALCRLLAPLVPHTAEEIWAALEGEGSVHEQTFAPTPYAADSRWERALAVRDEAMKELEEAKERGIDNPLDAGLTLPADLAEFDLLDLADLCGVSRVLIEGTDVVVHDLHNEPRCDRSWRRDESVKQRSDGGMLSDRDAAAIGVE